MNANTRTKAKAKARRTSSGSGGYQKTSKQRSKQLAEQASKGKTPAPELVVIKKREPLLPGIKQALQAMTELTSELREQTEAPFTVNIDPIDNAWTLVVRGYDPGISYFTPGNVTDLSGVMISYPVRFVRSMFVRNPAAKQTKAY